MMAWTSLHGFFFIWNHEKKRPTNDRSAIILTDLFIKVKTGQLMMAQPSLVGFFKLIDTYGRKPQSEYTVKLFTRQEVEGRVTKVNPNTFYCWVLFTWPNFWWKMFNKCSKSQLLFRGSIEYFSDSTNTIHLFGLTVSTNPL